MSKGPLAIVRIAWRAVSATLYAAHRGTPGMDFARVGRRLGMKLLFKGSREGVHLLVAPVSSFRYFEFQFVLSCLPDRVTSALDVSSPRLFSFYVSRSNSDARIVMLNPDIRDRDASQRMAARAGLSKIEFTDKTISEMTRQSGRFDCVWAISVIEHISGEIDDTAAVTALFELLAEGGRLILTVPVGRVFEEEYRDRDEYGTQPGVVAGRHFFQRIYDESSLHERIVKAIGVEPTVVRWFGERTAGHYAQYEQRWIRDGIHCTVDDPREMADNYREYASWKDMPGLGVCGMMFERRPERAYKRSLEG